MTTYITFGSDHDRAHPWVGSLRLSEGYVTIDLPFSLRSVERDVAFAVFGERFAFDYSNREKWDEDNKAKGYYPAGELARITVIHQGQRAAALNAIEESALAQSIDLDLNREIVALRKARDILANIIGTESA